MITIVTDRLYLVTEKIISIYINEYFDNYGPGSRRVYLHEYSIYINFVPTDSNGSNNIRNDSSETVQIKGFGLKRTSLLFKDIVRQIREQCPDQLYLDKVVDGFLSQEVSDDAGANQIHRIRKEKRRSKKVLRRAKRGHVTGSK